MREYREKLTARMQEVLHARDGLLHASLDGILREDVGARQLHRAFKIAVVDRAHLDSDHNAEWNFLMGIVCSRRGWLDEAKRYMETAVQMEPGNPEYRNALASLTVQSR